MLVPLSATRKAVGMGRTCWLAFGAVCAIATSAPAAQSPPWAEERGQVSHRDLAAVGVAPAPKVLTLQEALQTGLANNAGFRSSIASLLDAQGRLRVARQLYSLNVAAAAQSTHPGSNGSTTETTAETDLNYDMLSGAKVSVSALLNMLDSEEQTALEFSVTQPLIRGAGRASERYEALRSAYVAYRRSLLRYSLERQDLALSIISGYFGVVQTREQVTIQEQGLAQADRAVQDFEARLKEGMTTKIEVTRAQLSQASRRLALTAAKLSFQDSMDNFLQTLGLQVGATPELTTQLRYKPAQVNLEALVPEALRSRPELKIEELTLEDARADLRLARNRRRPSLDLFGSTSQPVGGANDSTEWRLGIQTSIPLNSRSLDEAVHQAERGWLLAEREQSELRQSITTQVRSEARALQSQQANLEILRQSLEVAREKLRLADISVEEGVGVYRDKIEAQEQVTAAERDLLNAQIQYYFTVLGLRRAVGQDVLQGLADETQAAGPPAAQPKPGG